MDEAWAETMLVNFLRHQFGIRNIDTYLGFYGDLRSTYDLMDDEDLDTQGSVRSICSALQGKIKTREKSLLLLRLMEFCGYKEGHGDDLFKAMVETMEIPEEQFKMFADFVANRETEQVMLHQLEDTEGQLKTLLDPHSGMLLFTYTGPDTVMLNDVPVLSGAYQVWLQSSVLKGKNRKPVYYSTILRAYQGAKGLEEDKNHQVEFCGRDINFRFPNSNNGTHNLSFTLQSGELLAIMGGSGTGKTTLLSLLNGSMRPQEGTITINGHDIAEPEAKNLIGFVPQDDLLIEELTVYQNLWYTAKLCFEGMDEKGIDERVIKTLKDLGLDAIKDLKVGSAINKYISGGQRKRLNIALELIREPAVLFLDEPTSGLSSSDTEMVINLLKEQTYKGKLIIVNIHQPSSDVYKLFDRLWLLDKGGYPVYDGNPINAITYFKEAAAYADAETSACPTCGNVNPEVVLNIIDEKALNNTGEISEERKVTPEQWHKMYLDNRPEFSQPKVSDVPHSDQKKPGPLKQFAIFLRRNIHTKITNVQYLCITLLEAPLLALVCSFLTRYAPPEGYSVMDNKNLVSYFFMAVIVATFIGMSGSAEEIIKDRALLKRESFLHLSYGSYIWSKIIFMAGISLIQTVLFILVGNYIMGLHGLFAEWWLILFVTAFLSNLMGLLLSQCLSSVVAIYISIPMLLIPQILLCGLVVSFSDLTPKSTTGNVPLIGDIIPSRWSYEALAVTSFTDNPYEAPFFELDKQKYENQFYNMGVLNELQSQLETKKDEEKKGKPVDPMHMETIRMNLPEITSYCQMKPYEGDYSYTSLYDYMKEAEDILAKRSNDATLKADNKMAAMIREQGKESILQLKRDNYNIKLEDCVIGADQRQMLDVIDGHLVPRMSIIYLTPRSQCGRAPFYSSEKIIGSWHIKTLWFNMSVLLMMCIILIILLLTDWPGKIIRK
ncbi:MAG: ATP-binding cassette domain-containing protein [Prevotella sp.]|nr:ATP-binding cassette domain-containing protein [Prevotella sp.]